MAAEEFAAGKDRGRYMIRYLNDREKQSLRELWEEAFPEDSKEFGDYYFKEKVGDNRILALIGEKPEGEDKEPGPRESHQERADAMIHLNPYRLMVRGRCWQADYLVGVATRRDKRHRGYMRCLLLRMMKDLRQEQMPFCFLMPADEAIYKPFGFTYIYNQERFVRGAGWERLDGRRQLAGRELPAGWQQEKELQAAEVGAGREKVTGAVEEEAGRSRQPVAMIPGEASSEYQDRLQAVAEWMNRWLEKHYQVYARRDREYLERLVKEIISEDGTLDILFCGNQIAAVESWWGRGEREQRLLYGEEPYVERIPGEEKPAIMARIISPEAFVPVIHLREQAGGQEDCTIPLYIQDPLIEENEGRWMWHLNRETSWLERQEEGELYGQYKTDISRIMPRLTLTIDQMTAWLFGYHTPREAEGYDELIETLHGVFLDEVV